MKDVVIDVAKRYEVSDTKLWTWWINDDADEENDFSGASSVPGQSPGNHSDNIVNGHSDLIDFFPVWLDLHDLLKQFPPSEDILPLSIDGVDEMYRWHNFRESPTISERLEEPSNRSDDTLRIDPAFRHNPDEMFTSNIVKSVQNNILARGIPELSFPIGCTNFVRSLAIRIVVV